MNYIGIDPGKAGGVSSFDGKSISARKCPENASDMYAILQILDSRANKGETRAIIEHVWGFPSDTGKTAFTFGKNFGMWLAALEISEIPYQLITPRLWQGFFDTPKLVKKERKRWLKEKAATLPYKYEEDTRVTFNVSDAILLSVYAKEVWNEDIKTS